MKIRVECRGETVEIQAAPGARLLEYLQQASVPVNAAWRVALRTAWAVICGVMIGAGE